MYAAPTACAPAAEAAEHGGSLGCETAARHLGIWVLDDVDIHDWDLVEQSIGGVMLLWVICSRAMNQPFSDVPSRGLPGVTPRRSRYDRRWLGRPEGDAMTEIVIGENDDYDDRSPVWKLSIEEFERAASDPDHPLHEEAAAATMEIGKKLNAALAPIMKTAYSGIEESLANIATYAMGAVDWNAPLRKLSLNLGPGFTHRADLELLRVHEASADIDIVSEVPEDTSMGEAVATVVSKLDSVVQALRDRSDQADRHSAERHGESSEASEIAKRSLAASRVALRASKGTLTVSAWILAASTVAALTGIGAIIVGLLTLAATK